MYKKITKKSTWVDMTAFVDVSFLILSFFMLVTNFKPKESIPIDIPNSVSSELVKENDSFFIILMEKTGRIFIEIDPEIKKSLIEFIHQKHHLRFDKNQIKHFIDAQAIGFSFNDLKGFLSLSLKEQKNLFQKGIPIEKNNDELSIWIKYVKELPFKKKINWFIKGDNKTPYPVFKHVLNALKKNQLNKFLLITNPISPPVGSPLYNHLLEKNK